MICLMELKLFSLPGKRCMLRSYRNLTLKFQVGKKRDKPVLYSLFLLWIWKKSSEAHKLKAIGMTLDTFQRIFEELGEKLKLTAIITANAYLQITLL